MVTFKQFLAEADPFSNQAREIERLLRGPEGSIIITNRDLWDNFNIARASSKLKAVHVFHTLERKLDKEDLEFTAKMLKHAIKKVFPEYTQFETELPMFRRDSAKGLEIKSRSRTPDEWDSAIGKLLSKSKTRETDIISYAARAPDSEST